MGHAAPAKPMVVERDGRTVWSQVVDVDGIELGGGSRGEHRGGEVGRQARMRSGPVEPPGDFRLGEGGHHRREEVPLGSHGCSALAGVGRIFVNGQGGQGRQADPAVRQRARPPWCTPSGSGGISLGEQGGGLGDRVFHLLEFAFQEGAHGSVVADEYQSDPGASAQRKQAFEAVRGQQVGS